MTKKIAVIGAGISGISVAKMLSEHFDVTVFEQSDNIGGLIKCKNIEGNLFHLVGGHVFNSLNNNILQWFWKYFDKENEFVKTRRNAKILLQNKYVGYPIENYLYQLDEHIVRQVVGEIFYLAKNNKEINNFEDICSDYKNFEHFLSYNFGETLYNLYFKPYNLKLWKRDLCDIPLAWLEGKLPMPKWSEMIISNIIKKEENKMVHSTFYYPKQNGSQFIINRLSENLNILLNTKINSIEFINHNFTINNSLNFDFVIYTGDVRELPEILNYTKEIDPQITDKISHLESNSTSNLLCEVENTDLSWLYLPENNISAHRIIFTGNFSSTNNADNQKPTCVVEFSGNYTFSEMCEEVKKIPLQLKPLFSNYQKKSYIIHNHDTRHTISELKIYLESINFYLLGRFAEWEYFNMDKCMESAQNMKVKLIENTCNLPIKTNS